MTTYREPRLPVTHTLSILPPPCLRSACSSFSSRKYINIYFSLSLSFFLENSTAFIDGKKCVTPALVGYFVFIYFFFFVQATFSLLPPFSCCCCCFFLCYVKSAGESRSQHITHELILMVGSFGSLIFSFCACELMDIRLPDGETCFCSISISFSPMEWPVHAERIRLFWVKKKTKQNPKKSFLSLVLEIAYCLLG